VVLAAWFFFSSQAGSVPNPRVTEEIPAEKSVAVLPFESLSESKSDAYFADGYRMKSSIISPRLPNSK
jgi:TolB-like protein